MSNLPFHFSIFHLLTISLLPISTLSFQTLTLISNNSELNPQISLLGGAKIISDPYSIQLTTVNRSKSGLVLYKNPIKFQGLQSTSFSTEIEFSLSGQLVGLSLLLGPYDFVQKFMGRDRSNVLSEKEYLGIEFGYSNDSYSASDGDVSVPIRANNKLLGGKPVKRSEKVKTLIEYDATSKRLEIRLSEMIDNGIDDSFQFVIADNLDLSKTFGDNEVYAALGSYNRLNQMETCNVYSWNFGFREVPKWMHSLPVDPHSVDNQNGIRKGSLRLHRRKFHHLTVLAGLILATGCGALLAFIVLFMWATIIKKRSVFSAQDKVEPVYFRYERVDVVAEKDGEVV